MRHARKSARVRGVETPTGSESDSRSRRSVVTNTLRAMRVSKRSTSTLSNDCLKAINHIVNVHITRVNDIRTTRANKRPISAR
jgi:hypothetical protein